MARLNLTKTLSALTGMEAQIQTTVLVVAPVATMANSGEIKFMAIVMWTFPVLTLVQKGKDAEIAPMSKPWQPSIHSKIMRVQAKL